jgi:hypothetical protein
MSRCQKAYKRYGIITILSVIRMVSWGFAFKKGFIIFLWSIVWIIIGTVIGAVIGGAALFGTLMSEMSKATPDFGVIMGGFVLAMVGFAIGGIISTILVYATILKITMETTLEEAKKP